MIRILIVDDELPIANLLRMNLTRQGYVCTCAYSGPEAADLLEKNAYDLVLLDIKHIRDEEHKKLTGVSNAHPLAFARYLSEHGVPMWIRHVLVPGITDNDAYLRELRAFLDTLDTVEKVEVLPYHTMGVVKYENLGIDYPLRGVEPPSEERVRNAKEILRGKA